MKSIKEYKDAIVNIIAKLYGTACGCGTKQLTKKGKIVVVVAIVITTLIVSRLFQG